jgi:hypothetical protein
MVSLFLCFVCCGCSVHHFGGLPLGRIRAVLLCSLYYCTTLHITTAHIKSSQSAFTSRFLVTDLNGESSASVGYCTANIPSWTVNLIIAPSLLSLPCRTQPTPIVLVITSRHGPHRKHRSSIVGWVFIAAETCLRSCCPETAVVYSPISQWLHSSGYALRYWIILGNDVV